MRAMFGGQHVPHLVVRVEEALHVPGARGVVHVVGVGVGAEGIARVERKYSKTNPNSQYDAEIF